jgi:small subunit ribosomal protein S9
MPQKKSPDDQLEKKVGSEVKKGVKKKPAPKTSRNTVLSSKSSSRHVSKGKRRKLRVEDKFFGKQYFLGVGKRKTSVALVRLYEGGEGKFLVNNRNLKEYFFDPLIENSLQPFSVSGKSEDDFNIVVKVTGGGFSSQAEAVRHGISRALILLDAEARVPLKRVGLLTRDARVKERKKPGLKRARRAPQWKKR